MPTPETSRGERRSASFPSWKRRGSRPVSRCWAARSRRRATSIFIGATIDGIFRAIDARNGQELWREKLDAPAHSIPSTYMGKDGKQYVVVPAGGGGFLRSPTADTVIAFRLN